jgi:hypothetical protein
MESYNQMEGAIGVYGTQSISIKHNYHHPCKVYRLPSIEYILLCLTDR